MVTAQCSKDACIFNDIHVSMIWQFHATFYTPKKEDRALKVGEVYEA